MSKEWPVPILRLTPNEIARSMSNCYLYCTKCEWRGLRGQDILALLREAKKYKDEETGNYKCPQCGEEAKIQFPEVM